MLTILQYLVIAVVIGGVAFVVAAVVFGRGEQMAPLAPRTSPAELPAAHIDGDDVRRVRFTLALRGYRMSDVDWTLDRLAAELDDLRHQLDEQSADRLRVADSGGGDGAIPTGYASSDAIDVDSGEGAS